MIKGIVGKVNFIVAFHLFHLKDGDQDKYSVQSIDIIGTTTKSSSSSTTVRYLQRKSGLCIISYLLKRKT